MAVQPLDLATGGPQPDRAKMPHTTPQQPLPLRTDVDPRRRTMLPRSKGIQQLSGLLAITRGSPAEDSASAPAANVRLTASSLKPCASRLSMCIPCSGSGFMPGGGRKSTARVPYRVIQLRSSKVSRAAWTSATAQLQPNGTTASCGQFAGADALGCLPDKKLPTVLQLPCQGRKLIEPGRHIMLIRCVAHVHSDK